MLHINSILSNHNIFLSKLLNNLFFNNRNCKTLNRFKKFFYYKDHSLNIYEDFENLFTYKNIIIYIFANNTKKEKTSFYFRVFHNFAFFIFALRQSVHIQDLYQLYIKLYL